MATHILWPRVIAGGFVAELLVFAFVFSVRAAFGEKAFDASIVIGSAAMPFLLALWVCRGVRQRAALNGALVGAVAAGLYLLLFVATAPGQSQPLLYKLSHVVKVAGGMMGGLVASRRQSRIKNPESTMV